MELLTVIKNEPEIVEICINDIFDSSDEDEDIIPEIKDDIDIVSHVISEDLIKGENIFESNHLESVDTQVPLIKTENIDKTEDISDGNLSRGTDQSVEEVQDLNGNRIAKPPKKKDFSECHKTVETTSCKKTKEKRKAVEVPLFPVEPHDTTLTKNKHAFNKNKSSRKKTKAKMYNWPLKYHCDRCKYKSSWLKNLKVHKLIHLKPEEIHYFYCYHCSYKSKRKGSLKYHIFSHFKNQAVPFHCYICDFVTLKRDWIIEHFKKHPKHHSKYDEKEYKNLLENCKYKIRKYGCKKCAFRTYHYEKLKLHELTHKTEAEMDDRHFKYKCDMCNYKTFRHQDFKRHKLIHSNLKPEEIHHFYCYHCSYKCKQKYNLQTHIFSHFKNGEVPFHCYICDFTTLKRNLINEHFKKHPKHHSKCDETEYKNQLEHKKRKHGCKKCAYRTYQYEKLKLHELAHKTEAKMDDRHFKYKCDKCNYKTFRRQSFKRHKITHLKPEEIPYFYCYHCSYKCKQKANIQSHIFRHFKKGETHTKNHEKRYYCATCTFVTEQSAKFEQHELSHKTRTKKYRCDKCKYKTCWSNSFKRHKLIHLKPEEIQYFYCYHCSSKAKRKNDIKAHIFRHFKNGEVKFHCYICNFMTLKRKSITEHIKKHSKVQNY